MDDSLSAERGVAVDQDRHDARAGGVIAAVILLGAHDADNDGIDQLQMAGVVAERDVNVVVVFGAAVLGVAEVIFDVAVAVLAFGGFSLEFAEDDFVGLVDDMGQDVEPAAMGHSHDDFLDAQSGAVIDQGIEQRDERFAAFEAEAFLALLFAGEEFLESLGGDELVQQRLPLGLGQDRTVEDRLHALDQPIALGLVGDVDELDAERAAIGGAELFDQIAKRAVERALKIALGDALVHVGGRQAELGKIQQGMRRAIVAERDRDWR